MSGLTKMFSKWIPKGNIDWDATFSRKKPQSTVPKAPLPGQITKGAMNVRTFAGPEGKTVRRTTYRQRRRGSMVSRTGSVKQALLNKMAGESLLG
jgi:hypothetical protein